MVSLLARAQRMKLAGLEAVAARVVAAPSVEVGLGEVVQGEVVARRASPGTRRRRGRGCGCAATVAGWWAGRCCGARSRRSRCQIGVAVQDLPPVGVRLGGEEPVEEPLEASMSSSSRSGRAPTATRVCAGAPGPGCRAVRRAPRGSAACARRRGRPGPGRGGLGQPAHRGDVVLGGGDVLAQGPQPGRQAAGVGAQQLVQPAVDQAAAALAGVGVVGVAAGGAVAPGARARCSRRRAGSVRVPETIGAWRPQAEQAAMRRWQAGHHGCPVAREMPQGVRRAADRAGRGPAAAGSWGTAARPGSACPTGRRRPQFRQVCQVRRVGDEAVGADRPAVARRG